MKVEFVNVGRDKKNWSAELDSLSNSTLTRQIRAKGALVSSGIDFNWNKDGNEAKIYVGGFRHVGDLRVDGGVRI